MFSPEFFALIGAGGDLALVALVLIMWRFDRRLLTVELSLINHMREEENSLDALTEVLKEEHKHVTR